MIRTASSPTLLPGDGYAEVIKPNKNMGYTFTIERFGEHTCVIVDCGVPEDQQDPTKVNKHYYGTYDNCGEEFGSETTASTADLENTIDDIECEDYKEAATYMASATVYDLTYPFPDAPLVVEYELVVTHTNCAHPRVEIQEGAVDFRTPLPIELSKSVSLKGRAEITCSKVKSNEKLWQVWEVNPETGEDVGEPIDLGMLYKLKFKKEIDKTQ